MTTATSTLPRAGLPSATLLGASQDGSRSSGYGEADAGSARDGGTGRDVNSGASFAELWSTAKRGLRQTERWLDARGRWAWLATMVAGFFIAPPLGLLVLAYMLWSKRMFGCNSFSRRTDRMTEATSMRHSSGNAAFDAYKAETLKRLTEEQAAFDAFLTRLREARDTQEFDQFMQDRARAAKSGGSAADDSSEDAPRRGSY